MTTRDVIEGYLAAIESHDLERVATWLHDDIEVIEHPNKISPTGRVYGKVALREAGERGKALLASEDYEIRSWIIDGDRAAVQMVWTGTLHEGPQMTAQICSVITVKDAKIWRQEQYDCFVP